MQPGVPVQILPLEPQVLFGAWPGPFVQRIDGLSGRVSDLPLFTDCVAPDPVAGLPAQLALAVGQLLGQADLVSVEVEDFAQARLASGNFQGLS